MYTCTVRSQYVHFVTHGSNWHPYRLVLLVSEVRTEGNIAYRSLTKLHIRQSGRLRPLGSYSAYISTDHDHLLSGNIASGSLNRKLRYSLPSA